MTRDPAPTDYLNRVSRALESIEQSRIFEFVDLLCDAQGRNCRVFICGNGGSATTASHMATDLGVGSQRFGPGVRAISLSDSTAAVTATGNDVSFSDIFAAQIRLLGMKGDILVAISASGDSPNVLEAAHEAHARGMTVVGMTGFSGGRLKSLADLSVHVATADGDYGVAEDVHLSINHMVTELVRRKQSQTPVDVKPDA